MTRCFLTVFQVALTGLLVSGLMIAPGFGADLKQDVKQGFTKAESSIKQGTKNVEKTIKGANKIKSTFKKSGSKTKKSAKGLWK